jgi:hypothetical protein
MPSNRYNICTSDKMTRLEILGFLHSVFAFFYFSSAAFESADFVKLSNRTIAGQTVLKSCSSFLNRLSKESSHFSTRAFALGPDLNKKSDQSTRSAASCRVEFALSDAF